MMRDLHHVPVDLIASTQRRYTLSSPRIEALLFDMGGVVLEVDFGKVFQAMDGLSALPVERIRELFSMDEAYQQHERGLLGGTEYLQHLREQLQLDASDADIIAAWNSIFGKELTPVLDAIEQISHRYPCDGFTEYQCDSSAVLGRRSIRVFANVPTPVRILRNRSTQT